MTTNTNEAASLSGEEQQPNANDTNNEPRPSSSTLNDEYQQKHITSHTQNTNIDSLAYRPEYIDGEDDTNKHTLSEFGNKVNDQIEAMQQQREGWRALLQKLYEEDNAQDDRARELKRQVMLSEAEAMANPTYHRWMRDREQHGVGAEKIDSWFTIDSLLPHTPYLCTIPCPRNLSEKGWEMIEETVEDLFGSTSSSSKQEKVEEEFTIEWWPLLQHHDNENQEAGVANHRRRLESQSAFQCSSAKGKLRQVFDQNPKTLQQALVECPCFFIGDSQCTQRLSSPFSTPLVIYVVRGSLIAVEPYYSNNNNNNSSSSNDNNNIKVKFPTSLAPTVVTQQVTSANCQALLQLREWIENISLESLPERSFAGVVMMTCLSAKQVTFSILNLCPLDAVSSPQFEWSDLVGLIVNAQNKRDHAINKYRYEHDSEINDAKARALTAKEKEQQLVKEIGKEIENGTISVDDDTNSSSENNLFQNRKRQQEKLADESLELMAELESLMNPLLPAPSIDVIFRGSWMKCDPEDDACVKGILANMEMNKRRDEHESESNRSNNSNNSVQQRVESKSDTREASSSSSALSNGTIIALAATACVAGVSIGVGLGLKLAAGNTSNKSN